MKGYPGGKAEVRVRFAPSPTGPVHAGNIRTAVFNWLYARRRGGTFIVRMEDTDKQRSSMEYADLIIEAMEWLGMEWDEGPFFQSQHKALYEKVMGQLYRGGHAYPCFCTPEELEAERKAAEARKVPPVYSGKCRAIPPEEAEKRMEEEPHAIRFKVPEEGSVTYTDIIRGEVTADMKLIGDFVIRRSDGGVTYNFAAAVDDAMMRISHVIRGEDHISNTPRQIMVMKALNYTVPVYAHLPLIFSMEGAKLSKRDPGASFKDVIEGGYMPEAALNFMALIGWTPEDGREDMTAEEMQKIFSLDRVATRPAKFDMGKLKWLNVKKIREADPRRLLALSRGWLGGAKPHFQKLSDDDRLYLMDAVKENLETLKDLEYELMPFFEYEVESSTLVELATHKPAKVLKEFLEVCGKDELKQATAQVSEKSERKGKALFLPIRVALTGRLHGPSLKLVYSWLPATERRRRTEQLLTHLERLEQGE